MRQHYHPFPLPSHTHFFPLLFKQGRWWAPFQQTMCTYTSSDTDWCLAAALQGAVLLPSKSFMSSLCSSTFRICKVSLIHWPTRSLQGFVKQNTSPFLSQQPERREWSKDKAIEQTETWRGACGVKLKFWLPVQLCQQCTQSNIIITLCDYLEKNVPFYLLSVLHPTVQDTANKHELQSTIFLFSTNYFLCTE